MMNYLSSDYMSGYRQALLDVKEVVEIIDNWNITRLTNKRMLQLMNVLIDKRAILRDFGFNETYLAFNPKTKEFDIKYKEDK